MSQETVAARQVFATTLSSNNLIFLPDVLLENNPRGTSSTKRYKRRFASSSRVQILVLQQHSYSWLDCFEMFPTTLLTTLFLALAVAANLILIDRSPISLPLSRRLNLTSIVNLLKHDQARAKALKAAGTGGVFQSAAVVSESIENQAVTYVASVGVGSPATSCNVFLHHRSNSLAEHPF